MKRSIWLRLPMVIAAGSLLLNVASASASPGTNVRLTHDETAGAYVSAYTLGTGTAYTGSPRPTPSTFGTSSSAWGDDDAGGLEDPRRDAHGGHHRLARLP